VTNVVTVGALDPLYVRESGPSGFQTSFNFFSWSFFAVVVAGVAFSAVWRIGREDRGKVPRDPAWWRDWWKQVGVWGGLLLLVCIVRTVMHPELVLQPPGNRTVSGAYKSNAPAPVQVAGKLPVGTPVAAKWDRNPFNISMFYLARIASVDSSGQYFVEYGDGETGLVSQQDVVRVNPAQDLPIGTHVLACWRGAAMFPGTVTARRETLYTIRWDDGDTPQDVAREQIAPLDENSPPMPAFPRPK